MQLFSIKNKEPVVNTLYNEKHYQKFHISIIKNVFKTQPSKRISRVELAGKPGETYDRIFVSSMSQVTGFSKKGKQFFNFDTNMTEPIKAMCVIYILNIELEKNFI